MILEKELPAGSEGAVKRILDQMGAEELPHMRVVHSPTKVSFFMKTPKYTGPVLLDLFSTDERPEFRISYNVISTKTGATFIVTADIRMQHHETQIEAKLTNDKGYGVKVYRSGVQASFRWSQSIPSDEIIDEQLLSFSNNMKAAEHVFGSGQDSVWGAVCRELKGESTQ